MSRTSNTATALSSDAREFMGYLPYFVIVVIAVLTAILFPATAKAQDVITYVYQAEPGAVPMFRITYDPNNDCTGSNTTGFGKRVAQDAPEYKGGTYWYFPGYSTESKSYARCSTATQKSLAENIRGPNAIDFLVANGWPRDALKFGGVEPGPATVKFELIRSDGDDGESYPPYFMGDLTGFPTEISPGRSLRSGVYFKLDQTMCEWHYAPELGATHPWKPGECDRLSSAPVPSQITSQDKVEWNIANPPEDNGRNFLLHGMWYDSSLPSEGNRRWHDPDCESQHKRQDNYLNWEAECVNNTNYGDDDGHWVPFGGEAGADGVSGTTGVGGEDAFQSVSFTGGVDILIGDGKYGDLNVVYPHRLAPIGQIGVELFKLRAPGFLFGHFTVNFFGRAGGALELLGYSPEHTLGPTLGGGAEMRWYPIQHVWIGAGGQYTAYETRKVDQEMVDSDLHDEGDLGDWLAEEDNGGPQVTVGGAIPFGKSGLGLVFSVTGQGPMGSHDLVIVGQAGLRLYRR